MSELDLLKSEVSELKAQLGQTAETADASRRRLRRLTATNVVLAVVVFAFGSAGTAYALAAANTVNSASIIDRTILSRDINDGTITTPDLKDNALSGSKILNGAVTSIDVADNTLTSVDIATGAVRASDLGPIIERSEQSATIGPGLTGAITANCLASEKVIAGGHNSDLDVEVYNSLRSGNGWRVDVYNTSAGSRSFVAVVYCLAS